LTQWQPPQYDPEENERRLRGQQQPQGYAPQQQFPLASPGTWPPQQQAAWGPQQAQSGQWQQQWQQPPPGFPPPGPPGAPPRNPAPRKKGNGGKIAGGIIGGLVLVFVIIAVASHGSTPTSSVPVATGAPATSAAAAAAPAPATTTTGAAASTITYVVTGSSSAQVTYGPAGSNYTGSSPMRKTSTIPASAPAYYSIDAQLQGGGSVSCEILVGGTIVSKGTASGGYQIATCEISQDPFSGQWQDDNS
jgi:hypothetical protein